MENRSNEAPKPAKSGCCGGTTKQPEPLKEKAVEQPQPAQPEPKEESCCG